MRCIWNLRAILSCHRGIWRPGSRVPPAVEWQVGRVPVDYVVAGYFNYRAHQIPVRIDQTATLSMLEILPDQLRQQRGFTGSGLAYDVCVEQPIGLKDAERAPGMAAAGLSDRGDDLRDRLHRQFLLR